MRGREKDMGQLISSYHLVRKRVFKTVVPNSTVFFTFAAILGYMVNMARSEWLLMDEVKVFNSEAEDSEDEEPEHSCKRQRRV